MFIHFEEAPEGADMALAMKTSNSTTAEPEPPQDVSLDSHAVQEASKSVPRLPREVLKLIVTFALVAERHTFDMPCHTGHRFRPKVNLACLVLDRDLYHVARQAMYEQNLFVFRYFGSDIKAITGSVGLWACRKDGCKYGGKSPVINEADFHLGDSYNPESGAMKISSFGCILKHLTNPLNINILTIDIAPYTWRSNSQLEVFCGSLGKVKIHKTLVVRGLDVHLELDIRMLARALGMNVQPINFGVTFRGTHWKDLGGFFCVYMAAKSDTELEVQAGQIVQDPKSRYEKWLETAKSACVVNGLDYVSDFNEISL